MKRLSLALVSLAVVPQLALADDEDPGAPKHQALLAAMAKQACVPPPKVVINKKDGTSNDYVVRLALDGTNLVACAARTAFGPPSKPFACFTVDPAKGTLASRPVSPLPGTAYRVPSGCAEGFCKPKEKPAANTEGMDEVLAWSMDGSKVARGVGMTVQIYDAKTKAFQREFPILDEKAGDGNGFGVHDIVFVGDIVFVPGFAAGPDGGVWAFSASKGRLITPLGTKDPQGASYVNIYGGGYELADATHFVVHDGGYEEGTFDTTTGALTMKTLPKPAACTDDAFMAVKGSDNIGPEDYGDKPPAKCLKAVRAAQKKFWPKAKTPTGFVFSVGGKSYKIVQGTKKTELLALDAGATKPTSVALPVCKVK